ncbi:sce7726 family protein [Pseudoalteromonas sp. NC201]|uniref:sce7726 family protein n=1 Tax=Pseudoalteromonas sp. NC201 TaxID=1514074 RepID=UPI000C7CD0EB|nr:sce7726 family protein [Pseudoalteromonas sp. NC201]AUJ71390.1 hypothetical protein PNC201_15790 [Pseudoalteromonas sp. NC201]
MKRLLESDIKSLTIKELIKRKLLNKDSLIMSELVVGNFLRRVDLAFTYQNRLIAIEIKSEADSLYRLSGQLDTYLQYFDKVIVVADSKFIPKLISESPANIGLWELEKNTIKVRRKGRFQQNVSKENLLDFLDVVDLLKLTSNLNFKVDRNRADLEQAAKKLSKAVIKSAALKALQRKFREPTSRFLTQTCSDEIKTEDLKLLSRFQEQKSFAEESRKQNFDFWNNLDNYLVSLKSFAESV